MGWNFIKGRTVEGLLLYFCNESQKSLFVLWSCGSALKGRELFIDIMSIDG